MDSFEFNKIAAAVLITILVVIGIKEIANEVFHIEKPKQSAYKIEGVEVKAGAQTEAVKEEKKLTLITPLLASASIDAGKNVFKKCAACHSVDKAGANKIGPALWGVVNRKVGSHEGFKYSSTLQGYGKNWTFEELNGFLNQPMKYLKGTKMGFAGLGKDSDRANVIAYLNSLSDSPAPLK
jgi:cytochrome c